MARLAAVPDSPPRAVLYLRKRRVCMSIEPRGMPPQRRPLEERFWPKVDRRGDDECWPWTGAKTSAGYGHIARGGEGGGTVLAHRVSYELARGPIPDGLVLDHLCRRRDCVNPAHLEPVTFGENCMRGTGIAPQNAARTECRNGHPLTPDNVRIAPNGHRVCRACARGRLAAWKRKNPNYRRTPRP